MLKIFNSLTGKKEEFVPIEPGRIRMYVCGITVYDYCHLGHARMLLVFDMVVRYLRFSGFDVTYVRNITDIDDKIIKRAAENGEPVDALTARFIDAMNEDCAALLMLPPDHEPRATKTIDAIIEMIGALVDNGYAYQGSNGDVYYDVSHFAAYGQLSGKRLEDLRAGERVEVAEAKDDPLDFVLWKAAKPGEPIWDSPWGPGRPGWHIECSAMSTSILGNHFDIHGGGVDLKFPHHENEIAQTCGATGETFVNVWMHNGFVRVDEEKMSKSLGNFFTVRDVLKAFQPEVIRYFMLGSHYRSPLNYTEDNLRQGKSALDRLYTALRGLDRADPLELESYRQRFIDVMDDDFNTPEAVALLQGIAREINTAKKNGDSDQAAGLGATLREIGGVLGLLQDDPDSFLKGLSVSVELKGVEASAEVGGLLTEAQIEELISQRTHARKEKDWAESDRIRDALQAQGVTLEDGPDGTTWRRK